MQSSPSGRKRARPKSHKSTLPSISTKKFRTAISRCTTYTSKKASIATKPIAKPTLFSTQVCDWHRPQFLRCGRPRKNAHNHIKYGTFSGIVHTGKHVVEITCKPNCDCVPSFEYRLGAEFDLRILKDSHHYQRPWESKSSF